MLNTQMKDWVQMLICLVIVEILNQLFIINEPCQSIQSQFRVANFILEAFIQKSKSSASLRITVASY